MNCIAGSVERDREHRSAARLDERGQQGAVFEQLRRCSDARGHDQPAVLTLPVCLTVPTAAVRSTSSAKNGLLQQGEPGFQEHDRGLAIDRKQAEARGNAG